MTAGREERSEIDARGVRWRPRPDPSSMGAACTRTAPRPTRGMIPSKDMTDEAGPVAEAASDFDALEQLRRLAYSDRVKEPQQLEMWAEAKP